MRGDTNLKPNTYTYNAVINSLAKSKEPGAAQRAERVLQNMVNKYNTGGTSDMKATTINFNAVSLLHDEIHMIYKHFLTIIFHPSLFYTGA